MKVVFFLCSSIYFLDTFCIMAFLAYWWWTMCYNLYNESNKCSNEENYSLRKISRYKTWTNVFNLYTTLIHHRIMDCLNIVKSNKIISKNFNTRRCWLTCISIVSMTLLLTISFTMYLISWYVLLYSKPFSFAASLNP